jgi:hypothetical protein
VGTPVTARRLAGWFMLSAGVAFAVITAAGLAGLQPFKVNGTASLPRGLYIRTFEPIRRGAIIWFPLPAAMRDYVAAFPGAAAWFATPGNGLLKPVIGRRRRHLPRRRRHLQPQWRGPWHSPGRRSRRPAAAGLARLPGPLRRRARRLLGPHP